MEKRNIVKNQKGFTLIEIIAVLVILGILAAVAVPKYLDMTATARQKAVEGALASGASNVTMEYANYILQNNGARPTMANLAALCETTVGEYTAEYAAMAALDGDSTGVTVTITDGPTNWDTDVTTKTKDVILE